MSGVVYLIAQPTVAHNGRLPNLTPLAEWGRVQVLVQAGEFPRSDPEEALTRLMERLRDFNPATDYLAWAGGDTLAALLTGVALERMEVDNVRWLWVSRERDPHTGKRMDHTARYRMTNVPLFHAEEEEESDDTTDG